MKFQFPVVPVLIRIAVAPHARRGQNVLGDFDAVAGIREAAAQLKKAVVVYEASIP